LIPSDVIVNGNGDIVLINFDYSGRNGLVLLSFIPELAHTGPVFSFGADEKRLDMFFSS